MCIENGKIHPDRMFSGKRHLNALLPEFPYISVRFVHNYQYQAMSERTVMPAQDGRIK